MVKKSLFGFEKPENSPGFLLWQTTVVWHRLIKKTLEPHAISHAQFVIMAILLWFKENDKQVTQKDIIALSQLDKMTVSKSLKTLSLQKLINRKEDIIDTRTKRVLLTEKGRTLISLLIPLVERVDAKFFGTLSSENQQSLVRLLSKLVAVYDN